MRDRRRPGDETTQEQRVAVAPSPPPWQVSPLALQRAAGNRATSRWLATPVVQRTTTGLVGQPTITSALAGGPAAMVLDQPDLRYHFSLEEVEVTGDDSDYTATVPGLGEIGSLTLFHDDSTDTHWINNVDVDEAAQRRGVGKLLLQAAIDRHERIYASTQRNDEAFGDGDTRHLSTEGAALVASARRANMAVILTHPNAVREEMEGAASDEEKSEGGHDSDVGGEPKRRRVGSPDDSGDDDLDY